MKMSLARKFMSLLALIFVPTGVLGIYLAQKHFVDQLETDIRASLRELTQSEVVEIETLFRKYEKVGTRSASFLGDLLKRDTSQDANELFAAGYRQLNGAWRTDLGAHPSGDVSGVFLSNRQPINDTIKRNIVVTEARFDDYARGLLGDIFNMYLIAENQWIRIYRKDWAFEVEADHDFRQDVFFYTGDPSHNPLGQPAWTAVYYDAIWQHWMTSLITPVYIDDHFFGVVGHDVILDDLYDRILRKRPYNAGFGFICDQNQNIVVHPHYHKRLAESAKMGATLNFKEIGDDGLRQAISEVQSANPWLESTFTSRGVTYYLSAHKLKVLDWYYVTAVPRDALFDQLPIFRSRFIIGMAMAVLFSLIAISFLLWRLIGQPLGKISRATQKIGQGNLRYKVDWGSGDEMGRLAQSVNEMGDRLTKAYSDLEVQINKSSQLAAILESTTDMVCAATLDHDILYMNTAGQKLLGWSGEDSPLAHSLSEAFPPWAVQHLVERIIPQTLQVGHWSGETAILTPGGNEVPVSQVITLHRSEQDEPLYLSTIIRDITGQKESAKEMNRLRHLLKNIVDSMPSVLIGVDAKGQVFEWNFKASVATGLEPDQAVGRSLDQVFPELSEQLQNVREAVAERAIQHQTKVLVETGSGPRYNDITVFPLVANGVEGAVIRVDDVTDRVRIEEMMVQTEKMMSVGGLAAGMAHEINNPLGGILQGAQNIERRLSDQLPLNAKVAASCGTTLEQIHRYLEKREIVPLLQGIRDSGRRAAKIVDNMLQFSRKSSARFEPVDLHTLIDNTVDLAANDYDLKKKYDFKNIQVIRDYADPMPKIPAVATEIGQVLLNLLSNAAHAMAERLSGASPQIFLLTRIEKEWVELVVEDNGPGIEKDVIRRIFEPFFTTKRVGTGTGLGLSVSYMIVTNNHNGTITVDSVVGSGTRFTICLPLVQPKAEGNNT